MTPAETAAFLRRYNEWRRDDEDISQFDVCKISEAIDAAVEMIDRLESAEADALEQSRLLGMGASREAALMAKLDAAEKSDAESIAMYRKARDERDALLACIETMEEGITLKERVIDSLGTVLNVMADERDALRTENAGLVDDMNLLRDNNTALRVRIEEMEKQEPVKIQHRAPFVNSNGELVGYSVWIDGRGFDHWPHRSLYALPGAKGE